MVFVRSDELIIEGMSISCIKRVLARNSSEGMRVRFRGLSLVDEVLGKSVSRKNSYRFPQRDWLAMLIQRLLFTSLVVLLFICDGLGGRLFLEAIIVSLGLLFQALGLLFALFELAEEVRDVILPLLLHRIGHIVEECVLLS